MSTTLGRLEPVELRTVWNSEASDFTPWLAKDENLALLGETIGLDLELESVEKDVGLFRADIVCRHEFDIESDHLVLIENQLDYTDHKHLGQLLTYAAGLDAVTVVWIADHFTDEHRAALDWLNNITGDEINFFGLEIELWRIGKSEPAPKFNIMSQPNNWTKTARRRHSGELTERRKLQLEYWESFKDFLERHNSIVRLKNPRPRYLLRIPIGRSHFRLDTVMYVGDSVCVYLTMGGPNAKAHFHLLHQDQKQIEAEIGQELIWHDLPDQKQTVIEVKLKADAADREDWHRQHAWMHEQLEAFDRCFRKRVASLNAADFVPDEVDK